MVAFGVEQSHEVGSLLARAGMSDVVDAHVVVTAARGESTVLTSDPGDLQLLSSQLATPVRVQPI